MSSSEPPTSPLLTEPNLHTITCVTWSTSGRNVGLGTPDGFLLYSTEAILEAGIARAAEKAAPTHPSPPSQMPPHEEGRSGAAAQAPPPPRQPRQLQEICRRVVPGGVGILALCGQSSVVAVVGVASRASASTVRLMDASRPLHPYTEERGASPFDALPHQDEENDDRERTEAEAWGEAAAASPGSPRRSLHHQTLFPGAAVSRFLPVNPTDLRCATLAEATFPTSVSSVHFTPYFIIVALTGDPRIPGSHQLYVFDLHLQQKLAFSPFPCRSNRFLHDCISVAGAWAPAAGAGVSIKRFRALLPAPHKGAVRLLTLKHVALLPPPSLASNRLDTRSPPALPAAFSDDEGSRRTPHYSQLFQRQQQQRESLPSLGGAGSEEKGFFVGDKTVHKAALRAVAITQDGKHGVTIGEKGTNIKLIEFINDTTIVERMALERGKTPAVVDSTSLHIVPVPASSAHLARATRGPAGGGYPTQHLVVCITSSGTVHLFLCDTATSTVVYSREKTLCPRPGIGFPFAFAAMFPLTTIRRGRCGLMVLQWNDDNNATSYLARREGTGVADGPAGGEHAASSPHSAHDDAGRKDIRLVAFDIAYILGATQMPQQMKPTPGTNHSSVTSSRTPHSPVPAAAAAQPGAVQCRPSQAYYFPLGR